jgi:hypothetical protein
VCYMCEVGVFEYVMCVCVSSVLCVLCVLYLLCVF